MSYRCPACQKMIFNRRLERCEFCGEVIPAGLRFSAEEIAKLDREMKDLEERRKKRDLEQAEELKIEQQARSGKGLDLGPHAISEWLAKWPSDDAT